VPPDAEQFAEMIKAMAELQRAGEQVPETGRPDAVPAQRRVDAEPRAEQTSAP
jgi:hypothetical protein